MPTEPVSSPEKEVREIAQRYISHYYCDDMWYSCAEADGGNAGRCDSCDCGYASRLAALMADIAAAQRLATERAERECAEIARKHAGQWEPQRHETADLEDEAHIAAAFAIAEAIEGLAEGRSKGK